MVKRTSYEAPHYEVNKNDCNSLKGALTAHSSRPGLTFDSFK